MSIPLKNYLEAYNKTAAEILCGNLPEAEAKQALSMIAVAGTERLISVNASLAHARRLCELTAPEEVASTEGCTIRLSKGCTVHLHSKDPSKPPRFRRVGFLFGEKTGKSK